MRRFVRAGAAIAVLLMRAAWAAVTRGTTQMAIVKTPCVSGATMQ